MLGLNVGLTDWQNFLFAFILVTLIILMNYFSPIISSKFQISATIIKLLPIGIIAIAGLFASFIPKSNSTMIEALSNPAPGYVVNFGDAIKKRLLHMKDGFVQQPSMRN